MSAEAIANVIRTHQPTTGMSVASGVTCQCGYWNGEERGGVNRPPGFQGLQWHQAQELEAAGFGLVAAAKSEALEAAADAIEALRPDMGPGINITQYREGRNDAFVRAADTCAYRAAAVRGDV